MFNSAKINKNRKISSSESEKSIPLEKSNKEIYVKDEDDEDKKVLFNNLPPNSIFNYAQKEKKEGINISTSMIPNMTQNKMEEETDSENFENVFKINKKKFRSKY